jgi:NADH:ubiquinone oxidoreductase subunit 2 (subunit N)
MKKNRFPSIAILCVLVLSIVIIPISISTVLSINVGTHQFPPDRWITLLPLLLILKTVLSSVNSILLTILFVIYLEIYQKTKAEFSLGLLIFTMALLIYSITSNPLIHGFAGFRLSGAGLGPFTMLPDLFTCIASAILLYLSRQ